jgi:Tol biopolymer transport system component
MQKSSGSITVFFAVAALFVTSIRPLPAQMRSPNMHPSWSPDGKAIVFERLADGDSEIVVLDIATGSLRQLTSNRVTDSTPRWQGDTIYFRSNRDGILQWYRMDIDGQQQQPAPQGPPIDSRSADGRICVTEGRWEGGLAIFRCDPTGTLKRLTAERHAEQPAVSADGRYVIYENRDTDPAGIYMMNADGSQRHRLSDGTAPMWSPNGPVALFKSLNAGGAWEVTVYDLQRPDKRQLGVGVHPAFSPDGRQIVFMSDRSSGNEIWVMSATGENVQCLTCELR